MDSNAPAPDDPHRHPRTNADVIFIATLPASTLLLFRDQRFRGYSILSFDRGPATRLEALSARDYVDFCADLRTAGLALRQAFSPNHMNYELLGNTNPHLHWHIIPRYHDDPRWGRPIWEGYPRDEFRINRFALTAGEYRAVVASIRTALAGLAAGTKQNPPPG